jgi:hypothetical protein
VQVPKPAPEDRDDFTSLLPPDPRVEVEPMFGNIAGFVNGDMFAGLFGSDVGVRLAPADQAELTARGGGPFGPPERPMGGYVGPPAAWRDRPDLGAGGTGARPSRS